MRRFAIILLAVATALVMALPATAKKPVEPDPEPEPAATYAMTIEIVDGEGVETTCPGADVIEVTRTDTAGGKVTHFESEGAVLSINAPGLEFDECHGDTVFPEYFRFTLDGDQVAMLWIFDVTFDDNGEYRTDFRMGGPYVTLVNPRNGKTTTDFAEWTACDPAEDGDVCYEAAGTFVFVRYEAAGDPMFTDLENGSREFALRINLAPTP